MLLGKVPGGGFSPLVSSAPKTPPKVDDDLSEVVVTAKRITTAPSAPSGDEALPEITVTGTRIPWYAWAFAGVVAYVAADKMLARR